MTDDNDGGDSGGLGGDGIMVFGTGPFQILLPFCKQRRILFFIFGQPFRIGIPPSHSIHQFLDEKSLEKIKQNDLLQV